MDMLKKILDLGNSIENNDEILRRQNQISRLWFRASTVPPETEKLLLMTDENNIIFIGMVGKNGSVEEHSTKKKRDLEAIKYWMPLPGIPRQEIKNKNIFSGRSVLHSLYFR